MNESGVRAGTCRTCGRDLVNVPGERTYHPAVALLAGETCPVLKPIPGTNSLSFEVAANEFIPNNPPAEETR